MMIKRDCLRLALAAGAAALLVIVAIDGIVAVAQPLQPIRHQHHDTFSFAIVADPALNGEADHETSFRAAVNWIIDKRKSKDIELVFVIGDVAWGASGERRNLQIAKEILDTLTDTGILYIPLIGDDEVAAGCEEEFNDVFGQQYQYLSGILDNWQKAAMPAGSMYLQNFSFDYKQCHFVCADFVSRESGNEGGELHDFPGGSWPWFKKDIENCPKPKAANIILMTHIPMFRTGFAVADQYLFSKSEMDRITGFLSAYAKYVDSNYAGHIHENWHAVVSSESGSHLYDVRVTDEPWFDTRWPESDDHETTVRVVSVDSTATSISYTQSIVDAAT